VVLALQVAKTNPRSLDLMIHWAWRQMSTQTIRKSRFDDFLALVPEVNKKQIQKFRFDDFLALAPEVDDINPRSLDLMSLWPWLQKSAKSVSEVLI
jgi:hypothetical protein